VKPRAAASSQTTMLWGLGEQTFDEFQCEGRCRAHQLHIRIRRVNLAALGDRVIDAVDQGLAHDTTGEQVDEDDAEERRPRCDDIRLCDSTSQCRRRAPVSRPSPRKGVAAMPCIGDVESWVPIRFMGSLRIAVALVLRAQPCVRGGSSA